MKISINRSLTLLRLQNKFGHHTILRLIFCSSENSHTTGGGSLFSIC